MVSVVRTFSEAIALANGRAVLLRQRYAVRRLPCECGCRRWMVGPVLGQR